MLFHRADIGGAGGTSSGFVSFTCHAPTIKWSYSSLYLQSCMRAVSHSRESYLRVNSSGLLCIQHLIEVNENAVIVHSNGASNANGGDLNDVFVDYLVVPMAE